MKLRIIILTFFILSCNLTQTCANQDSIRTRFFLIGTEMAGYVSRVHFRQTGDRYNDYSFLLGPQVGIFISSNFVVGFSGEFSQYYSSWRKPPLGERAAGLFFRYYFDQSKIIPFLKWKRLSCYTGLTFHRANYYTVKDGTKVDFSGLDVNTISWNTGFNIKLWKGFHSELSLRPVYYVGYRFQVAWRVGVEYHFTKIKD